MDFEKLISDFAERHSVANLAAENNAAALEELVNLSETWRRLLADFRPVASLSAPLATRLFLKSTMRLATAFADAAGCAVVQKMVLMPYC